MRVIVAPPALQELAHAIDFYSPQAAGLAQDLVDEFDKAIAQIGRFANSGVRGETAEVVAFAHQRRKPDYWADRS